MTVRSFSRSFLILLLFLAGCKTLQQNTPSRFSIPPAPEMHEFPNSTRFLGLIYDEAVLTLTLVPKDPSASRITHYWVEEKDVIAFAKSGGYVGWYERNIESKYPTTPRVEVNGMRFLPIESAFLSGVHYSAAGGEFSLLQKNHSVITYTGVPLETYTAFLEAPIKKAYVAAFIEPRFSKRTPESRPD